MLFFYGNRIKLLSDRGPFTSSFAWMQSLLNISIASVAEQKEKLTADGGEYCGYDAEDVPELDGILSAAEELQNLFPKFFDDSPGGEKFMLYHGDLSTNNILIDPTTHHITGIVDWECVSLQPAWKVPRPPQLLYGPEINSQFCERNYVCTMPPIPPPHETPGKDAQVSELRASLEKALLRRVFNGRINVKGTQRN
jgi:Phosphotransferase enzyme family